VGKMLGFVEMLKQMVH